MNATAPIASDSPGSGQLKRFLLWNPLELVSVLSMYLLFTCALGPRMMKQRQPFNLRRIIIVYNVIQMAANLWLFVRLLLMSNNFRITCSPPHTGTDPAAVAAINMHQHYTLLKYFDLVETIMFVLRKKEKQVSFLHLYHHVGSLGISWYSGRYFPGGEAFYVAIYNTFAHLVMYFYYLLTCWDPVQYTNVWWKKYVTILQMVQHVLIFASLLPSTLNHDCTYPKFVSVLHSFNIVILIYFFLSFYKSSYTNKKKNI